MNTPLKTIAFGTLLSMMPLGAQAFEGPRGPGFGPPHQRAGATMNPEDRAAMRQEREQGLLERIREHAPERHKALLEMKQSSPKRYRRTLMGLGHVLRDAEKDPAAIERFFEIADLHDDLRELAEGYGELSSREQSARRKEMEATALQLFELKQEKRQARLAQLEERLAELKDEIAQRARNTDELIGDYVDNLTSEVRGL